MSIHQDLGSTKYVVLLQEKEYASLREACENTPDRTLDTLKASLSYAESSRYWLGTAERSAYCKAVVTLLYNATVNRNIDLVNRLKAIGRMQDPTFDYWLGAFEDAAERETLQ